MARRSGELGIRCARKHPRKTGPGNAGGVEPLIRARAETGAARSMANHQLGRSGEERSPRRPGTGGRLRPRRGRASRLLLNADQGRRSLTEFVSDHFGGWLFLAPRTLADERLKTESVEAGGVRGSWADVDGRRPRCGGRAERPAVTRRALAATNVDAGTPTS